MDIVTLRKKLNLTQDEFARRLGLKSKGHICQLEAGDKAPSVRVALELERLSRGILDAGKLNPDIALVRSSRPRRRSVAA